MSQDRSLSCRCGLTRWRVAPEAQGTLLTCYCRYCQAVLRHLGAETSHAAPEGGMILYQTLPDAVRFTHGRSALQSFRIAAKGVLRWQSGCCGSPVANTLPRPGLPFVALILPRAHGFGTCRNFTHTEATGGRVRQRGMGRVVWGVFSRGIAARLSSRTASPFFEGTEPISAPRRLTPEEARAAGLR